MNSDAEMAKILSDLGFGILDSPGRAGSQKPGFCDNISLSPSDSLKNPVSFVEARPGSNENYLDTRWRTITTLDLSPRSEFAKNSLVVAKPYNFFNSVK
jgi:hypothetical protein